MRNKIQAAMVFAILCQVASLQVPAFSATSAHADGRSQWQQLMQQGSAAKAKVDFDIAKAKLEQAASESKSLGTEEQLMSLQALGALAEDCGNYADAESHYRKASELPDSIEAQESLAEVLEKQGRHEQAVEVRDKIPFASAPFATKEISYVISIQPALKKSIVAKLPKLKDLAVNDPAVAKANSWTRLFLRLNPKLEQPTCYVKESSGDKGLDATALAAVEALSLSKPLKRPIVVDFSFDFNMETTDDELLPRTEAQFKNLKSLLAWQQKNLGADNPELANTITAIATNMTSTQAAPAQKLLKRACDIWRSNGIRCQGSYATFQAYGDSLIMSGNYAEAVPVLRDAMTMAMLCCPQNGKQLADCLNSLSVALNETGDKKEAKELSSQAKAISKSN